MQTQETAKRQISATSINQTQPSKRPDSAWSVEDLPFLLPLAREGKFIPMEHPIRPPVAVTADQYLNSKVNIILRWLISRKMLARQVSDDGNGTPPLCVVVLAASIITKCTAQVAAGLTAARSRSKFLAGRGRCTRGRRATRANSRDRGGFLPASVRREVAEKGDGW